MTSKQDDDISDVEPGVEKEAGNIGSRPVPMPTLRLLAIAAFLIGVLVTLMHRPWSQPEAGDEAIWDYVAQCILRGQTPYHDVVEIKTPLSAYLSAAAMLIGRSAGLQDVIAVRLLNVLMVGSLSAVIFLVATTYFRSRLVACLAVLIPLTPAHFADWMVAGTEPKLPMMLFGMLSLLLIVRRQPFWAGFFSMLACLCWQPGLLFTGVALLMFSRYLTNWRDRAAIKVLLGAVVPLAVMILYFYSIGALGDLWKWTVLYNLRVYAPETAKSFSETLGLLWRVAFRVFKLDLVFVALSLAGLIMFGLERSKARLRAKAFDAPDLFIDAMVIVPVIYLAFCLINLQSGPDLIPLFPFIGLFAGWFLVRLSGVRYARGLARHLPAAALIVLCALILYRSLSYRVDSQLTRQEQESGLAEISTLIAPGDPIYVHGTVELLVLSNRQNMNPHIDLRKGKDDFIALQTPGGFPAFIDEMERMAPRLVAISRAGRLRRRAELMKWVDDHYEQVKVSGFEGIYLRRQR